MNDTTIRLATEADAAAIADIFNHYVLTSTCTYQTEAESAHDRRRWLAGHGPAHPITVAEQAGVVVAWGSLSPFNYRAAYRQSVENSVYVRSDHHRRGIGRLVLVDLLDRATRIGHHTVIALISAEQAGSIQLHRSLGFEQVGYIREAGRKFDRWLDVAYLQKML